MKIVVTKLNQSGRFKETTIYVQSIDGLNAHTLQFRGPDKLFYRAQGSMLYTRSGKFEILAKPEELELAIDTAMDSKLTQSVAAISEKEYEKIAPADVPLAT